MAPRPDFFRAVDAEGVLHLVTPSGELLELVADGPSVRLEVPRGVNVWALLPGSFRSRRQTIRFAAKALATHGLTLTAESAGRCVLRMGYNTTPGWFARLLGLAPAYIPVSALRLLFRW